MFPYQEFGGIIWRYSRRQSSSISMQPNGCPYQYGFSDPNIFGKNRIAIRVSFSIDLEAAASTFPSDAIAFDLVKRCANQPLLGGLEKTHQSLSKLEDK